jgi:hypothetical protein
MNLNRLYIYGRLGSQARKARADSDVGPSRLKPEPLAVTIFEPPIPHWWSRM